MKKIATLFGLIGLAGLMTVPAFAAGTAAGTDITNIATVNFSLDGGTTTLSVDSPETSNVVAEVIDVTVVSQDATAVISGSGSTEQVLTYVVTNTGNGSESFDLTTTQSAADGFDPATTAVYIDNGDGVFDAATDTLYDGTNDPVLDANTPGSEEVTVFQVSDMGTVADSLQADLTLTATSNTGTDVAGTTLAGAGDNDANGVATDAVIGTSTGTSDDTGSYLINDLSVTPNKTSSVVDPFGGTATVPGSVITYTITATVAGTGTVSGLQIVDAIPANTTYNNNSLTFNGAPVSDTVDTDEGDVTAGTVTVNVGDITVAAATDVQTVVFTVTVL